MAPHVPGAFLCACRWVVGHASLWRTLSARWRRACVWSGVGADTRRHASFAFRGGACCFALWGGDACTFALRGGGGACIFALRSGGACCFALWGGGACSFTFRGSAGCFCFRCVKYGLRNLRAARRKTSHTACADVAGSTAPAFGAPSALGGAPAFGSTSALGGAPAFGAAPSASAFGTPSQLGGTSAFGTCAFQRTLFLAPGPRQCVSFCSQVAKVFSAPPKAVVLLPPLQVVAVGLRATLLKRQAVDLGLWRRQAVLHLRRRLGGIAETSQRTMELGGRFRSSMLRPGRRQAFRHRHFGARRTAPSSQQQYKGYTVAREGQPGSGAIATLHGLLSGLVSMHSTQPRLQYI